ncbi:DUF3560 domain-containing protein [Actinacidiphila glaucinigra]|uniref:DUF3560 domain-containing protein n=1 Tax=Actinacidiphila glaucinigra TaxID=235986 RepID=UPI003D8AA94B
MTTPAAPQAPSKGTITITHTRATGTLLSGSRKGDGVFEIVRPHGFRWFRSLGQIGIQQSRDQAAKRWYIDGAAQALRAAGWTVVVEINEDDRRSFAEAEQERYERADARAEGLTEAAGRAAAASDAAYAGVRRIADGIPFGQPILVGHHSEGRARRDVKRMDDGMRKSVEQGDRAKELGRRAVSAEHYAAHRRNPAVTLRRIKELEADQRRNERWRAGESAGGFTRDIGNPDVMAELERRRDEIAERLQYWRDVIAKAEADGFKVWGPSDFTKGDFARIRGRWYEVLRVNKVSVTVPGGPDIQPVISLETHAYKGMRRTAPYDEVTARLSAEEMRAKLAAADATEEPPAPG